VIDGERKTRNMNKKIFLFIYKIYLKIYNITSPINITGSVLV
jgi:hypothetical protein